MHVGAGSIFIPVHLAVFAQHSSHCCIAFPDQRSQLCHQSTCSVDLYTVVQCLAEARAHTAGAAASPSPPHAVHDALIIAADSAPPHAGFAFHTVLDAMAAGDKSSVLLQPLTTEAQCAAFARTPSSASAPVIRAFVAPTSDGKYMVRELQTSVDARTGAAGELAALQKAFVPLVIHLKSPDALMLQSPDIVASISSTYGVPSSSFSAERAAGSSAGASAPTAAAASVQETTVQATGGSSSAVACDEIVVPVEAAVAFLATDASAGVYGHKLAEAFRVGAMDGRPHALPAADAAVGSQTVPAAHAAISFAAPSPAFHHAAIRSRAYARVGLLGNPSDGFHGKTLATTIRNFAADVWLLPASDGTISLLPHPLYDPQHFANLRQLSSLSAREGYSGGMRLMTATLHRFFQHCRSRGVQLPDRGFALRYHTTIPRQVGLAGSSAIITAIVRALLQHYGVFAARTLQVSVLAAQRIVCTGCLRMEQLLSPSLASRNVCHAR